MSLQFNYRDGNGDFQGIELISYADISDKFAAPKNILTSQMWPDIAVTATYCRGSVFITVSRIGQSGEAYVNTAGSDCGLLNIGYAPPQIIRQVLGSKASSGAWLVLEVHPDRKIKLLNWYSEGDNWAIFSGSLSYAVNK